MYLALFLAPMLLALITCTLAVPYLVARHVRAAEAPMVADDTQAWADELSLGLDVEAVGVSRPRHMRPRPIGGNRPAPRMGACAYTPRHGKAHARVGACPATVRSSVFASDTS